RTLSLVRPALLAPYVECGESAVHLCDQFDLRTAHDAHGEFNLLLRVHLTRRSASSVTRGKTSAESRDRVLYRFGLFKGFCHPLPCRQPYGPVPFVIVRVERLFKPRGGPLPCAWRPRALSPRVCGGLRPVEPWPLSRLPQLRL